MYVAASAVERALDQVHAERKTLLAELADSKALTDFRTQTLATAEREVATLRAATATYEEQFASRVQVSRAHEARLCAHVASHKRDVHGLRIRLGEVEAGLKAKLRKRFSIKLHLEEDVAAHFSQAWTQRLEGQACLKAKFYDLANELSEHRAGRRAAESAADATWKKRYQELEGSTFRARHEAAILKDQCGAVEMEASDANMRWQQAQDQVAALTERLEARLAAQTSEAQELHQSQTNHKAKVATLATQVCEVAEQLRVRQATREARQLRFYDELELSHQVVVVELQNWRQRCAAEAQQKLKDVALACRVRETDAQLEASKELDASQHEYNLLAALERKSCRAELHSARESMAQKASLWHMEQAQLRREVHEAAFEFATVQQQAAQSQASCIHLTTALHAARDAEQDTASRAQRDCCARLGQLQRYLTERTGEAREVSEELHRAGELADGAGGWRGELHSELQEVHVEMQEVVASEGRPWRGDASSSAVSELCAELRKCQAAITQLRRMAQKRAASTRAKAFQVEEVTLTQAIQEEHALTQRFLTLHAESVRLRGDCDRLSQLHNQLKADPACLDEPAEAPMPVVPVLTQEATRIEALQAEIQQQLAQHRQLRGELAAATRRASAPPPPRGAEAATGSQLELAGRALQGAAPVPKAPRSASDRYTVDQRHAQTRIRAAQQRQDIPGLRPVGGPVNWAVFAAEAARHETTH